MKKTEEDLILNVEKNTVNHSFDIICLNMNGLTDKHAPFKKVSKYQLKLKTKPWITAPIHKTILVKNSLFKKYIKLKDPVKKTEAHDKYKHNTNLISTVIQKSIKNNYNEFFKNNMNIIKNTWKRRRNLILWKQSASPNIHVSYSSIKQSQP